jgi:hypothetical protein
MNSTTQQPEGVDGTVVQFSEHLWPGLGICAFLTAMTFSLGVAYGHAYGLFAGALVGLSSTALLIGSMFINAPLIRVDDLVLRVGKARLPVRYIGEIRRLDKSATKAAIRDYVHPQAHLLVKSWVSESLVITVTDTTDPHPYWQISTRKAAACLTAIELAKTRIGAPND